MANQLRMAKIHTILTLREQGWSFRRIGRELGIRREPEPRPRGQDRKTGDGPLRRPSLPQRPICEL